MYRALKSAQVDMNEMLLKFADEVTQVASTQGHHTNPSESSLENSIKNMMNQQNAHFNQITSSLRNLDLTMSTILSSLNNQKNPSVNMADKIPSIQPTSSNTDLKDICVTGVNDISNVDHEEDLDADIQPDDIDEAFDNDLDAEQEEEVVEEEDAEQEEEVVEEDAEQEEEVVEEDAEQEEEVVEEEDAEQEEEAEELEVEEWSYKGRLFFKDAENTVYLNDGGELGDPVGIYDHVKNIVKKLPSN